MIRRFVFRLLLPLSIAIPVQASAPAVEGVMRLASLEWLPYTGTGLEQEGWSSFVADAAARQSGYRTKIEYFPWTRAMQLGTRDPQYAGYFPAYYTEERARTCHFSTPIGSSTVGLVHLKSTPLQWSSLQDLAGFRIGAVAGFSNGPSFDAMAREGKLQVDTSPSDMLNLRKLLARRVDIVVIDKLVLRYLLATEPGLARERHQFAFHDKPLAELPLHICFQRTPAGRELQQAFDQAVQSLPLRKLESEYFQRLEKQ
jgi:polar amino acid transport system substrate-binding protein